jgi:hypothetical protein
MNGTWKEIETTKVYFYVVEVQCEPHLSLCTCPLQYSNFCHTWAKTFGFASLFLGGVWCIVYFQFLCVICTVWAKWTHTGAIVSVSLFSRFNSRTVDGFWLNLIMLCHWRPPQTCTFNLLQWVTTTWRTPLGVTLAPLNIGTWNDLW